MSVSKQLGTCTKRDCRFVAMLLFILSVAMPVFGQPGANISPLKWSAYLEPYYSYDVGKPDDHNRSGFAYSHARHHEVNINLGLMKVAYEKDIVRANLAFMTGTYANANLAAEPVVLKNIYEANAGVKIAKSKNLWVDAGIFTSHIGFESAVGKDCWNLTRSMLADNSPYYESGAKLSYTSDNEKWFLSALYLNGWQRIQRADGNHTPAFGHQLTFKPSSKITLNSSSFIGNDKPDTARQMRYFHNFYGIFQVHDQFGFIAGFDLGAEQTAKNAATYHVWYSPVLILKVSPSAQCNIAARAEYYHDAQGVIIATGTPNGFQTTGYSLNFDYFIRHNVMWRIEGRGLSSKDKIFINKKNPAVHNFFMTTSLCVSL